MTIPIDYALANCLYLIDDILSELEDIRLALERGRNPSDILYPPFNPLKTIGKYW
jgi:hypothetical protein